MGIDSDKIRQRKSSRRREAFRPETIDKSHLETMDSPSLLPASWIVRNQWIVLAMASGACAAFNGVFAKL